MEKGEDGKENLASFESKMLGSLKKLQYIEGKLTM